jgi:hypothetical protein
MDYQKLYNAIILNAQKSIRSKKDGSYFEKHHIIPKCLGGSNDKNNLVLLTAKEHFVCHNLLCELYPKNWGLVNSIWFMCNFNRNGKRDYIVSSREYQRLRMWHSNSLIGNKMNVGRIKTEATRKKIGDSNRGKKLSEEHIQILRTCNLGKKRSDEFRKGVSDRMKGKTMTPEQSRMMSERMKGENHPFWGTHRSEETKQKLRVANSGEKSINWGKPISQELKDIISKRHKGKIVSAETRKKMSDASKGQHNSPESIKQGADKKRGVKVSDDVKKRISITMSKHKRPLLTCPYCQKTMDCSSANRYHFENCKNKLTN